MNESELLELRSRTVELTKFLPAHERRALLSQDVDDFIANGGKIEEIARGVSGAFPDAGMPIKQQKEFDRARANMAIQSRINHSIAQSRKGGNAGGRKLLDPSEINGSRFAGAFCPVCHTNVRYLSNAACVKCTTVRDRAKSKAMQGNSRRADGRKER